MIATKNGMASHSTQELIDYVEKTNKQVKTVPAFIRRTSFSRWNSNSAAICAEIQKRQGESKMNMITKRLATDLATTFEAYRHIEAQLTENENYSDKEELMELGYKLADLQRKTGIVLVNHKFLEAGDFMERWAHIS
jgi:hypothetical protein